MIPKDTTEHPLAPAWRTFRPDVCCEHEWTHWQSSPPTPGQWCTKCGAECLRDHTGQIVEYVR